MVKIAAIDQWDKVVETIEINKSGFEGLRSEPNGVQIVEETRHRMFGIIENIDSHMSQLLKDDEHALVMWAHRMKMCTDRFHTLDKNLAFIGKPQWSWLEVIGAIAVIYTITKAAEETLQENDVEY